MAISASALRQNIYKVLDRVAKTGVPVEIERKGKRLRIIAEDKPGKLSNIKRKNIINGDVNEIVEMDWSGLWQE